MSARLRLSLFSFFANKMVSGLGEIGKDRSIIQGGQSVVTGLFVVYQKYLEHYNLPFLPLANGQKVIAPNMFPSCSRALNSESTFIPQLPLHMADTLLDSGSRSVNVQRLTVPRIVKSLSQYSNHLNSDASESRMDSSVIRWLSNFWEWFHSYEHKDVLFPPTRMPTQWAISPSVFRSSPENSRKPHAAIWHHKVNIGYSSVTQLNGGDSPSQTLTTKLQKYFKTSCAGVGRVKQPRQRPTSSKPSTLSSSWYFNHGTSGAPNSR